MRRVKEQWIKFVTTWKGVITMFQHGQQYLEHWKLYDALIWLLSLLLPSSYIYSKHMMLRGITCLIRCAPQFATLFTCPHKLWHTRKSCLLEQIHIICLTDFSNQSALSVNMKLSMSVLNPPKSFSQHYVKKSRNPVYCFLYHPCCVCISALCGDPSAMLASGPMNL